MERQIKGRFFYKYVRHSNYGSGVVGPFSYKTLNIGSWMKVRGRLRMCVNGFHFMKWEHRHHWKRQLGNNILCKVEVRGRRVYDDSSKKGIAQQMKILYAVNKDRKKLARQPKVFEHAKSKASNRKRS